MKLNLVRVISVFDKRENMVEEIPIALQESQLNWLRNCFSLDKEDPIYSMLPINKNVGDFLKKERVVECDFDFSAFEYFIDCYVS